MKNASVRSKNPSIMRRSVVFGLNKSLHFLLSLVMLLSSVSSNEPGNIEFPKKYNNSKVLSKRYFYLPPATDGVVIDNRFRTLFPDLYSNSDKLGFYRVYGKNKELLNNNLRHETDHGVDSVRITEMGCENSLANVYFRALLSSVRNADSPIIENVDSEFCKMEKVNGNEYQINFNREQFANCGIVDCSDESDTYYCLTIRFPTVPGLKMIEDFIMTLQCKPRARVVSHVKKIKVKSLDTSSRMAPKIAVGGHENSFQTDIGLYRRTFGSKNAFDARVEAGGTVILGEQLLLRVAVKEGDGWRYSKISEVKVQQFEKNDEQKLRINSMYMLDSNGCVNPQIREICYGEQYKVTPLENYLLFEAFMFENMKEHDEMVLSIKAIGCVDGVDCTLNCPSSYLRKARSVSNNDIYNNRTIDWNSDVSFRIAMENNMNENEQLVYMNFLSTISYVFCVLFLSLVIILTWIIRCLLRPKNSIIYD